MFYVLLAIGFVGPERFLEHDPVPTLRNGDRQQHISGLHYYIAEEWHTSPFYIASLNYPEGTYLTFTDSIPLLAPLAKLAHKATGIFFEYFDDWLVFCLVAQGLVFGLICFRAGVSRLISFWILGPMAIMTPFLLMRFEHAALCAHFLILLSLLLYLESRRTVRQPMKLLATAAAIPLVAVFVHPYLMLMCLAVFGVTAVHWSFGHKTGRGQAVVLLIATPTLIALMLRILGAFTVPGGAGGYGHFSTNLLSFLVPERTSLLGMSHWSADATGGQYEGFAFPGLGFALIGACTILVAPRTLWKFFRRHWLLATLMMGLLLFAVSHRVFAGNLLLLDFPLPYWIENQFSPFRSSGRFVWPVVYLAVLAGSIALTRAVPQKGGLIAFLLLAGLAQALSVAHRWLPEPNLHYAHELEWAAEMSRVLETHDRVCLIPAYEQLGAASAPRRPYVWMLQRLCARVAKPLTGGHVARGQGGAASSQMMEALLASGPEPGVLYMIFPEALHPGLLPSLFTDGSVLNTRQFAFASAQRGLDLPSSMKMSAELKVESLEPGQTIDFRSERHMKFSTAIDPGDGHGAWARERPAYIYFEVDPETFAHGARVELWAHAFISEENPVVRTQIDFNGENLGAIEFLRDRHSPEDPIVFEIPSEWIRSADGLVVLRFTFEGAASPLELGVSKDSRILSVHFRQLQIFPIENSDAATTLR